MPETDEAFDAATYVTSAIFNSVAYPPNMPDYLIRHIEAEAAFAQRLDDAGMTLGGASGGPIGEKTKAERQKDKDDEAYELMAAGFEAREERERQEWARTPSTVAGVSMTGAEWAELADRLRNDQDLHRRLIETFRARGMSEGEAEARYERVATVAEIAAIPPAQRTDEQRETVKSAEADPTFKQDMQEAVRFTNKNEVVAKSGLNQTFSQAATTVPEPTPNSALPATKAPTVELTVPAF